MGKKFRIRKGDNVSYRIEKRLKIIFLRIKLSYIRNYS